MPRGERGWRGSSKFPTCSAAATSGTYPFGKWPRQLANYKSHGAQLPEVQVCCLLRRLRIGTIEAAQTWPLCFWGWWFLATRTEACPAWGRQRSGPDRPNEVDKSLLALTPRNRATWAQWLLLCGALCRLETDLSVHADITSFIHSSVLGTLLRACVLRGSRPGPAFVQLKF